MNAYNKEYKIMSIISYVLFFMFFVFGLIAAIRGMEALDAIKSYYDTATYDALNAALAITLVGTIVIGISVLVGVSLLLKGNHNYFLIVSFILLIIVLSDLVSVIILSKLSSIEDTFVIMGIVGEVFAFILAMHAFIFSSKEPEGTKYSKTCFSAYLIIFVFEIASLVKNPPSDTFAILKAVFLMFSIVIALVCMGIFIFIQSNNPIKEKPVLSKQENSELNTKTDEVEAKTADDPVTQLEKLKNLLDKGVITKEEYEEKRKKYVDML